MKLGGWVSNPTEKLYLFLMWTLRRDIWHDLEAQKRQKHALKNFINDQGSHATSWAAVM